MLPDGEDTINVALTNPAFPNSPEVGEVDLPAEELDNVQFVTIQSRPNPSEPFRPVTVDGKTVSLFEFNSGTIYFNETQGPGHASNSGPIPDVISLLGCNPNSYGVLLSHRKARLVWLVEMSCFSTRSFVEAASTYPVVFSRTGPLVEFDGNCISTAVVQSGDPPDLTQNLALREPQTSGGARFTLNVIFCSDVKQRCAPVRAAKTSEYVRGPSFKKPFFIRYNNRIAHIITKITQAQDQSPINLQAYYQIF